MPSRPRSAFSRASPSRGCFAERQRRAGRRVDLHAMMDLGDLDVPLGPEHARRALDQLRRASATPSDVLAARSTAIFLAAAAMR